MSRFDFFIAVNGEMIPDCGEDAYLCMPDRGIIAVFDGCGGLGSRRYPSENHRTGAYLAARKAAGTLRICAADFNGMPDASFPGYYEARLRQEIAVYNTELNSKNGTVSFHTDMIKSLPSTAAIAVIDGEKNLCDCVWAGDSRLYIMDSEGLHCLNCGADETFSSEMRLINYINADMPFTFDKRRLTLKTPCVVIAATDGAYAFFRTPMEFEYMLLRTLAGASSPGDWEDALRKNIALHAGDDYTLTAAVLGYGGFGALKAAFTPRRRYMLVTYVRPLHMSDKYAAELWERYKDGYLRD